MWGAKRFSGSLLWWAAGLAVLTLITRIPLRSTQLFAWDSANFALALQHYNVAWHQPQPPGYILYVAAARLLHVVVADANAAYVWLSVVASVGAVWCAVLVGGRLFGTPTGVLGGLILTTSSLFWGQGEVAYPYSLPGALFVPDRAARASEPQRWPRHHARQRCAARHRRRLPTGVGALPATALALGRLAAAAVALARRPGIAGCADPRLVRADGLAQWRLGHLSDGVQRLLSLLPARHLRLRQALAGRAGEHPHAGRLHLQRPGTGTTTPALYRRALLCAATTRERYARAGAGPVASPAARLLPAHPHRQSRLSAVIATGTLPAHGARHARPSLKTPPKRCGSPGRAAYSPSPPCGEGAGG